MPKLVGNVRHAWQHEAVQLMAVPRKELMQGVVGQIIGSIQVQGYQVPRIPELGPGLQHVIVEAVQLAGAQETQPGDSGQHVDQALRRQIGSGDVELLDARFFPFNLHYVLTLQI